MFHGVFAVYITLPTKLPKPGDSVGIYVIQIGCVSFDIADCQSGPPHPSILKVLEKVPLDTDKAHKDPSWVDLHRHHLAPSTSEIWCGSMIDPNNIFLTFCSLPKFQEAKKTWNSWWFRDDPCLLWEGSQCLFFLRGWTVKFWEGSLWKNRQKIFEIIILIYLNYGFVEVGGKHIATSGPSKMVVSQWCRWGNVVGAARAICRYYWEYRTKSSKKSQVLL